MMSARLIRAIAPAVFIWPGADPPPSSLSPVERRLAPAFANASAAAFIPAKSTLLEPSGDAWLACSSISAMYSRIWPP